MRASERESESERGRQTEAERTRQTHNTHTDTDRDRKKEKKEIRPAITMMHLIKSLTIDSSDSKSIKIFLPHRF